MLMFESAGASRVVEKVRSNTQGVMFAVFVKAGDIGSKGTAARTPGELDATKLQLDLAQHIDGFQGECRVRD